MTDETKEPEALNNVKNLRAFISPDKFGRSIEGVLVRPDMIVATDSFKLIERTTKTGVNKPVIVNLAETKLKSFEEVDVFTNGTANIINKGGVYNVKTRDADEFPKYEQIIPTGKPVATVRLSPAHLLEIVQAFKDEYAGDLRGGMEIEIYGRNQCVIFKGRNTRALLMPIAEK